jgi:hypothetical protein
MHSSGTSVELPKFAIAIDMPPCIAREASLSIRAVSASPLMQFHMPVANDGDNFSEQSRLKQPDHLQQAHISGPQDDGA